MCRACRHFLGIIVLGLLFVRAVSAADPIERPNIVWIVVDDMSANFSCYGETAIKTPHVDQLASEGVRFDLAFTTAPVCSPCRSALITGCFQTTIGAHHHRSGRGTEKINLPDGITPVPALFQQAGYYTCIGGPLVANGRNSARPTTTSNGTRRSTTATTGPAEPPISPSSCRSNCTAVNTVAPLASNTTPGPHG